MSFRDRVAAVHGQSFLFTQRAERVLAVAAEYAEKDRAAYIGTEHIAQALLDEKEGPHAVLIKPRVKVKA